MNINEIDIHIFMQSYKDRQIIVIPNPGNAGDSLIMLGTIHLFDKLKLNYTIGDINKKYTQSLLFYSGGGNLVGIYNDCKKFLINNQSTNEIVILPHTIRNETQLLKSLTNNVKIICREKVSYDYVCSIVKADKNIFLSRDMAFYIDIPLLNIEKCETNTENECNCFRTDSEKTSIKIPRNNIDISNTLNKPQNTSNIYTINNVCTSFFNYLSKYNTINTNRLHVAIAGCLLNKNVNLHDNNYYKNKAVYDYSMKELKSISFK